MVNNGIFSTVRRKIKLKSTPKNKGSYNDYYFLRPGGYVPRSFLRLFSPTCDIFSLFICMSTLTFLLYTLYWRNNKPYSLATNRPTPHVKWV